MLSEGPISKSRKFLLVFVWLSNFSTASYHSYIEHSLQPEAGNNVFKTTPVRKFAKITAFYVIAPNLKFISWYPNNEFSVPA